MGRLNILFFFGLLVSVFVSRNVHAEYVYPQYPYQIYVQDLFGNRICRGSIIDEQHVLTAAHCLIQEDVYFTRNSLYAIAEGNGLNGNSSNSRVRIAVAKAYVPAVYNATRAEDEEENANPIGDIAVLKLKQKIQLAPVSSLHELNLPPNTKGNLNSWNSYENEDAVAAGFEWDEKKENSSTTKLVNPIGKIISNEECKPFYEYRPDNIQEYHLCAYVVDHSRKENDGMCKIDRGSSLVQHHTIVGIVTDITYSCNEDERPALFTRVSAYIDFINNARKNEVSDDIRSFEYPENN